MENPRKIYVTLRLIIIFLLSFILLCKNVIRKGSVAINLPGHGERRKERKRERERWKKSRWKVYFVEEVRRNKKKGEEEFFGSFSSLSAAFQDNLKL